MVSSLLDDPIADTIPLTSREKTLKAELEAIVTHGLEEFLRVGNALAQLRNRRLYRCEAATFAEYVKTKFALARSTADQLIRSSQVANSLIEAGVELPPGTTERVVRPISALPGTDLQAACWQLAESLAPARGVTQPLVSRLVRVVRNAIDGTPEEDDKAVPSGGGHATFHSKRRSPVSPERETPFLRPITRLATWRGFQVEVIVSTVAPPSAAVVWKACGTLAERCQQVQRRLEALYPELVQ